MWLFLLHAPTIAWVVTGAAYQLHIRRVRDNGLINLGSYGSLKELVLILSYHMLRISGRRKPNEVGWIVSVGGIPTDSRRVTYLRFVEIDDANTKT